ncbi:MAG: methyltransferase domain-containing protein [Thermodesulfobacteria bacterium]|nr:methyltransferase domain-containing protein [Thermodesulfobacteriota bacterium]
MALSYFDKIAKKYDSWFDTKVGRYVLSTEKRLVKELLPEVKDKLVLDLGCGTGLFTELVLSAKKVFGLDLSKNMLAIAKDKLKKAYFVNGDAYFLPFKSSIFDFVLSITVFEFIKEPEKVISEIYRVLKPGGKTLIGTMNANSSWFFFKRLKSIFVETAYRYARFYTPYELERLFKKAGFVEVETRGIIYFPSFFPFLKLAEKLDEKLNKVLKFAGAFILLRATKPDGGKK